MTHLPSSETEILERFARVVAQSLRIEPSQVTHDACLDDLGAESLDLAEITMEAEEEFGVLIAQKNILRTATEVFGEGVLARDGKLTEEGRRLLRRRLPEISGRDEVTLAELGKLFLRVGTWVRMIDALVQHTPPDCSGCGATYPKPVAGRLTCRSCGATHDLPSGEDLNRDWVRRYYETEYVPAQPLAPSPPVTVG